MKSKLPAICIVILFYIPALAQTIKDSAIFQKKSFTDSSYIKYYDNYLNVTGGWNTRNTRYILSYPQYNIKFVLSPKETDQFSFAVDYSFLYLYYSFTPQVFNLNNKDTVKGSSKRSTFATGFSFDRWYINFDYQNIKGYYLQNTSDFIPGWQKGNAYIQFPDLRTIQTGGQVGYNFNKKFSVSSLTGGKEQQLKTAITFFPMLAYWHVKLKNEIDSVQEISDVLTVNNDINLLLPASANIVFAKNFYVAGFAGPVIGIDFFKSNGYDSQGRMITTSGTKISTGYYARGSVGYTHKKLFAGIDAFARNYGHQQQGQQFIKYSYGMQVYAGTRFDPPKFLQKTTSWLQRNTPL